MRKLEEEIREYFDLRSAREEFPTEAGLLLHLGISEEDCRALREDPRIDAVFERARLRRADWLENRMVTEGKNATGCMNALKQAKNGGYADKSTPEAAVKTLVIRMEGVGGDAAL